MEPLDPPGGQSEDFKILWLDAGSSVFFLLRGGLDRRGSNTMPIPLGCIIKKGFIPPQGDLFDDSPDGCPEFGIEDPAPLPDLLEIVFKFCVVGTDDPSPLLCRSSPRC
jgi:hypothetical protein